jgi:hypothetical protein
MRESTIALLHRFGVGDQQAASLRAERLGLSAYQPSGNPRQLVTVRDGFS